MKVYLWLAIFLAGMVSACSPGAPLDEASPPDPRRAVVATLDQGVPQLTVDAARLEIAFRESLPIETVGGFSVESGTESGYFLQGFMQPDSGQQVSFAIELELIGGNLGFGPGSRAQKCTSLGNCSGCRLVSSSPIAGACICTTVNDPLIPGWTWCKWDLVEGFAGAGKMAPRDLISGGLQKIVDHLNAS